MAAILDVIKISVPTPGGGSDIVGFLGKVETYKGIEAKCGVTLPKNPGEFLGIMQVRVAELAKNNLTSTIILYHVEAGKKKRKVIFCSRDKVAALLLEDGSLAYKGDPKTKVRQPRRANYS